MLTSRTRRSRTEAAYDPRVRLATTTPGRLAPLSRRDDAVTSREKSVRTALLTMLTTEQFVLQTANNSTYAEASSRSTLYVMVLSSSLVATGFVAGSTDVLAPVIAIVLPAVFLLGLATVVKADDGERHRRHQQCGGGCGDRPSHAFSRPLDTVLVRCGRRCRRNTVAHKGVLRIPALALRRI